LHSIFGFFQIAREILSLRRRKSSKNVPGAGDRFSAVRTSTAESTIHFNNLNMLTISFGFGIQVKPITAPHQDILATHKSHHHNVVCQAFKESLCAPDGIASSTLLHLVDLAQALEVALFFGATAVSNAFDTSLLLQ
jgi:hypothetical protein